MKRLFGFVMLGVFVMLFSFHGVMGDNPNLPKKTPDLLTKGKALYEQNCVTCHGSKGDGKGPLGAALKPAPSDFTKPFKEWAYAKGDLKKVFETISKGIPNTSMVKWSHLPEQERWALVYFVVEFASSPKKK